MAYEVELSKQAGRYLEKINRRTKERIICSLKEVIEDPLKGDIAKIKGVKGLFRKRVGDYRIIYTISFSEDKVSVVSIVPRGDAYK